MEKYIRPQLLEKFEFTNYGHALEILCEAFPEEWNDIQDCLEALEITKGEITTAGEMKALFLKNLMMFYTLKDGEKLEFLVIY